MDDVADVLAKLLPAKVEQVVEEKRKVDFGNLLQAGVAHAGKGEQAPVSEVEVVPETRPRKGVIFAAVR